MVGGQPVRATRLELDELHASNTVAAEEGLFVGRPRTRGDCEGGERPCAYASCRHHLGVDVTRSGSVRLTHPGSEAWEEGQATCALDLADREQTLERIGEVLNLTRARVRQVEAVALAKYGRELERLEQVEARASTLAIERDRRAASRR